MAILKSPYQFGAPEFDADNAIRCLNQQIEKAERMLASRPIAENDTSQWDILTDNYLQKAFGKFSSNVTSVMQVGKYEIIPMNADEEWREGKLAKTLQTKVSKLRGLVELLQTKNQLEGTETPSDRKPPIHIDSIFLVHGHDNGLLHEVARFLEMLKQKVIVLREQPSSGRTIIEKFVDYSTVGYAIVLLTPDDRGGIASATYETQQVRARQNVVFELGYFIGKLGRNRVTALHLADVEIPSDYSGVAFVMIDDRGAWRLELAKELKAAGFNIDMNLAL